MNAINTLRAGLSGLLLSQCGLALAHHPVAQCKALADDRIQCTGGFSDGGKAPGVTMDVIAYGGQVLVPGKLDANSTLVFTRPKEVFYVLLEVGPGHTVEIDHTAIKGIGAAPRDSVPYRDTAAVEVH